jgi:diguanylate cyclase (GGDEF)-like protein
MEKQLANLSKLPSLPTAAVQLMSMFSDPDARIPEIVEVIQADPALAGKVLKAANSSRSGMERQVGDLHRAVVLLGKKTVMALALGFSLSEASMSSGLHARLFSDFWFQSLVRAVSASVISERFPDIDPGEAFTIGLLARIGRLALLNNDSERFVPLLTQANETGIPLAEIEAERADVASAEVTRHLFETWNLPPHCIEAVEELTASLEEACRDRASRPVALADVLRIATAFGEFFSGEGCGVAIAKVYELAGSLLGESEEGVHQLVDRIRTELDAHSELFKVDMSQVGTPMELLMQAMEQLSMLAVSSAGGPDSLVGPQELQEENGRLRSRVMELTRTSITDSLTSLYNRAHFMDQLRRRVRQAAEQHQPVGLLIADIDHFKQFNDVHGHLAGDDVLRSVASAMLSEIRRDDVLARYGGEEFVVLSHAANADGLRQQAERLRKCVEMLAVQYEGKSLAVTLSVGGTILIPPAVTSGQPFDADGTGVSDVLTFETGLFKQADAALYQSKSNGRNCVTITAAADPEQAPCGPAARSLETAPSPNNELVPQFATDRSPEG